MVYSIVIVKHGVYPNLNFSGTFWITAETLTELFLIIFGKFGKYDTPKSQIWHVSCTNTFREYWTLSMNTTEPYLC